MNSAEISLLVIALLLLLDVFIMFFATIKITKMLTDAVTGKSINDKKYDFWTYILVGGFAVACILGVLLNVAAEMAR